MAVELATATPIDKTSDAFLLDAYRGKGGFCDGNYLVPHPRETQDKFDRRKALCVYPNYTRKITNVFLGFLWKQSPTRSDTSELYDRFLKNANGRGTSLNRLLYNYQLLALILGTIYVIVDKSSKKATSKADESLPYCTIRYPDQLVDEEKDSMGEWLWVQFVETINGKKQYRKYTRSGWQLTEEKNGSGVIEQGEYKLGRVPVATLHAAEPLQDDDCRSESFVFDLAALNWDLFNVRSELRSLFRDQTFAILTLPVATDKEREALSDLTISTENALTYNPNGGGAPAFIAPPPDPISQYKEDVADIIVTMYQVANLEFVGGVQQSGKALEFQFQGVNGSLRGIAEQCEQTENDIATLVHLWQGQENKSHIAYASDFNIGDLMEAIAIAMDSMSLGMGDAFDKAIKKNVAKKILANDTAPSVMSEIDDEIDGISSQDDERGDRIAREAS